MTTTIEAPADNLIPVYCGRCGGKGGSEAWAYTGWTCYDCGGRGIIGWTTPEAEARKAARREADRKRREARAAKEAAKVPSKIEALVSEHPLLAWLTYPEAVESDAFLEDLGRKLRRDGDLSGRQIEAAEKAIVRQTERDDAKAAREAAKDALVASGVKVPEGRQTVEGVIVSTKWQENHFSYYGGGSLKMVVRADEGWSVWATVPSSIEGDADSLKGRRIRFTATLERSDRDDLFAFAKRPTKAELLDADDEEEGCEGHPAGPYDPMGQDVYCDGSCRG